MCASKPSRRNRAAALLLAALLSGGAGAVNAESLGVLRITPAGEDVTAATQIVVHFDRAVVPLGRMERGSDEVPVRVMPDPGCQWRWLDAQALACNLLPPQTLRAATRYTVEVSAGLQALDGASLAQAQRQVFVTERPRLQYAHVMEWEGAGEPVVRARFNQPVTAAAVAQSVRFGDVAARAEPEPADLDTPFYTPQGEARRVWWLKPAQALAGDREVAFGVRPGLRSASGSETGTVAHTEFRFRTFPAFRLLGVECQVGETWRRLAPSETAAVCAPLEGVTLAFSAPVNPASLKARLRVTPAPWPAGAGEADDPWAGHLDAQRPSGLHEAGRSYGLRLPFPLAAETDYRIELGAGVQDLFGRALPQAQNLNLRTGARTPRLVFEHENAVIEAGIESEVPAIVTNLERVQAQFERVTGAGLQPAQSRDLAVAPVRNLAFAMPLDIRGMLGAATSGAVRGGLVTVPPTAKEPRPFFAAVTPWQVHAKLGHSNLLVWVTAMADGKPVGSAEVAVLDHFGGTVKASARTGEDGIATLAGAAELDPKLERVWSQDDPGPLYVRVQRGQDVALLPLSSAFIVDTWRASREQISAWRRERHGHLKAWGATAQGVYRAGDRVQYKLYVRDDAGRSLGAAPAGEYRLQVFDPTGTLAHERERLRLSAFGALHGDFALTERAAVGWYRFVLTPMFAAELALEPMRVLVSDFVPSPFRVQTDLRAAQVHPGDRVTAVVGARLHGGGPFAEAPARLVARLQSGTFEPRDPLAARYRYDTTLAGGRGQRELRQQESRLDAQGEWQSVLELGDAEVVYGKLIVEGSVQDDRGRSIAAQASTPYLGRDRYIGLRAEEWVATAGQSTAVETLVVDAAGQPQSGTPYFIRIERMERRGARVKGAGNAYITRYVREWKRVATCQGRAQAEGMRCEFTPDQAGEYRLVAMVRDRQDRLHETHQWLHVQGPQAVLWEESPDYSLDLRADQAVYRAGQTAKLFVKNPFPGARALVTVERYGVLDHWVQTLDGNAPVIRIPVKPDYLPGAYVSVVVMSPRVEAAVKQGVDLGKPTFRMGYTTLAVEDPHREIAVEVKPHRASYRPGDSVTVDLHAQPRRASGESIELAVAVLDEAVFDLIQTGTAYFDPLKGFTSLEPLDLANYSLLTRLVGRQKFEKKGANPGGDGGADLALRSIEKFVAYWNPAVQTDVQGRAQLQFKLPDNLTGWRVLALAATPSDRMGLGQGRLVVSKPTELRPAMPNQAMLQDRFDAGFTVLNRDAVARTLTVELSVSGGATGQHRETLSLQPFERRTVSLPVTVDAEAPLRFAASAADTRDRDALAHQVPVRPRPYTQVAADASSVEAGGRLEHPLLLPAGIERGELRVAVSPTVIGNLEGAFRYLRDYPYTCWEQQLSRAVMAAHYLKLRSQLNPAPEWPQAEALPQATLERAAGFQAPGGGMAFWLPQDEHQSPYLSAYTALAFGWLRELGYAPPKSVTDKLNAYLHAMLKDDLTVRGYESAEARAQVRAVALAALAQQGLLKSGDLQRYASQLPRMGLFGQALFLKASHQVPDGQVLADEALGAVLARGQLSAGRLALQEDRDSAWQWQLGSELRSNCAALSAVLAQPDHAGLLSELPARLVRAITQARGARMHWENTQENVYCTRALLQYAERYEQVPVALTAAVTLDDQALGRVEIARGRSAALSRRLEATVADTPHVLAIRTQGQGRAYVDTRLRYVERADVQRPVSAGFSLERRYAVLRDARWQPLTPPLQVRRGERVKVEIEIGVPAWMTYVVVDDPVPGGLEPINPDLATAPQADAAALDLSGGAYPYPFYHRELRFDAVRHYADAIEPGRYRLSWIGQAIATGEFAIAAPRVEQMYDPDVYATGAALRLRVDAAP